VDSELDGDGEVVGQRAVARELRRFRERAGLSRTELARRVGYSRTYLSTCEKPGADLVSSAVVTQIDKELGAGGALVAVQARAAAERLARRARADVSVDPEDSLDVHHRGFLCRAGGVTTSPMFGDVMGTEMADLAIAMLPTSLTTAALDHAERTVSHIHMNFAKDPPAELLPFVNDHLRWVIGRLKVGQPIAHRRRLCSIVGHLAGQRAWLMFDLRRADEAVFWYRTALEAAQEAGDDSLAAWLLGGWSVVAFEAGDACEALELLDGAGRCATRTDHAPVAGWVDALKARAHAAVGDAGAARAALARVRQHTWLVADDTFRHGMDAGHGELNVDYYEGGSLLALGHVTAARDAFTAALATQTDGRLKGRAVITLQVALTYAQENDLDRAVELAASAWAIPADQRIGPIADRVRQLRAMITPDTVSGAASRIDQLLADESPRR
jgi:tetratricopeptide (TPR) repeat protein